MRTLLHASALVFLCLIGSAYAADLKTPPTVTLKAPAAPAVPPCTIASCTGFYAGMDISGNGTNVNLLNGIGGSLNANGTEIGGHVGFRSWDGKVYLGAEVGCAYDVGMNIADLTPSSKIRCMELAKLGGSLTALVGQQQSFQFPQALQNSFVSFYGILGASERYSAAGLAAGIGAEFLVAPNVSLTLDYVNVTYGGGGANAGSIVTIPTENLFRMGVNYNF